MPASVILAGTTLAFQSADSSSGGARVGAWGGSEVAVPSEVTLRWLCHLKGDIWELCPFRGDNEGAVSPQRWQWGDTAPSKVTLRELWTPQRWHCGSCVPSEVTVPPELCPEKVPPVLLGWAELSWAAAKVHSERQNWSPVNPLGWFLQVLTQTDQAEWGDWDGEG